MAPIIEAAIILLALAGNVVEAKPLRTPGRHAPPGVANVLASSKRSLHNLLARYYGTAHGLVGLRLLLHTLFLTTSLGRVNHLLFLPNVTRLYRTGGQHLVASPSLMMSVYCKDLHFHLPALHLSFASPNVQN